MSKVTRKQAEQALAAVREQFKSYLEPMTLEDGFVLSPLCTVEPTLVEDYDGHGNWAICWEEGPDEWAYRATMGGSSEEDRALAAEASAEFGRKVEVKEEEPVRFPKGVYAEPHMSFVLSLYED